MEFSDEDKKEFQLFCQSIIERPLSFDEQPSIRLNGHIYCLDWMLVEFCKYFFNGPAMYADDPPPNRLKNNPLFSKDFIVSQCDQLLVKFKTAKGIVAQLREERGDWRKWYTQDLKTLMTR